MVAFFRKLYLYPVILQDKFLHGLEGGQLCRIGILIGLCILQTEFMDTNYIKGIHQLATGRISSMVAVGKPIFINHYASL